MARFLPLKTVDFYFDPISPYGYLAWTQIPAIVERTGAVFHYRPVLFAAILNTLGQKGPAEIPSKREYTFRDVARWAAKYGRRVEGPPAHPFNPLRALRMITAVEDEADRGELAGAVLDACWGQGLDITKDSVLTDAARRAGLDGEPLLKKTEDPAVKERLKRETAAAMERGVFGVPTFAVGKNLFWGNDRLGFLEDCLAGKLAVDEAKLERMLARPSAADRT